MKILGIDYGRKRIGLALVDTDVRVVLPFGQFQISDFRFQISDLIVKQKIDKIVVGLPLGLDGKENENTQRVRAFADTLKEQMNVPIEFVDERFTTRQAERMGGTVSRDEQAAMIILQSYLDIQKTGDR